MHYKTDEAQVFEQAAQLVIANAKRTKGNAQTCIMGYTKVLVLVYRPTMRSDFDNRLKMILDALEANGVIEADHFVIDAQIMVMDEDPDNPRVEVHIEEHPKQVLSRAKRARSAKVRAQMEAANAE